MSKVGYLHLRRKEIICRQKGAELEVRKAATGGVTIAYVDDKQNNMLVYAIGRCRLDEPFNKKEGRIAAMRNLDIKGHVHTTFYDPAKRKIRHILFAAAHQGPSAQNMKPSLIGK